MNKHEIKILPEYFELIAAPHGGVKRFELRKNDRDYKAGDVVTLKEWIGTEYTGNEITVEIKYVLKKLPRVWANGWILYFRLVVEYERGRNNMIDEEKLIKILSRNSIFEKITMGDGRNVYEIIKDMPKELRLKPETPILEGDGYADGEMVYDTWYCPNCDTDYEIDEKHSFCPRCGQAIKWEW